MYIGMVDMAIFVIRCSGLVDSKDEVMNGRCWATLISKEEDRNGRFCATCN